MATQQWCTEFVQTRLYPIEQKVSQQDEELQKVKSEFAKDLAEMKDQVASRDADLMNAERRFEEIAKKVEKMEMDLKKFIDEGKADGPEGDGRKPRNIMGNPAFRVLDAYAGDHNKYNKWRSKLKGILVGGRRNLSKGAQAAGISASEGTHSQIGG